MSAERVDGGEEPLLLMSGYDCIVGVVRRFNDTFVLYDRERVLQKMVDGGMSYEDAVEFFEFNQVGAWMGDATPAFLVTGQEVPNVEG